MDKVIKPEGKSVIALAAVLLLGCAVGGIGFVLGRDSAEPAPTQSAARAVEAKHVAAARKAGYERGYAEGRRAGARSAAERVEAARDRDAASRDRQASGPDALAATGFDLDPGTYYIVQVAGGTGDARISDYAPMEAGLSYELCDAYGVCRRSR